MKKREYRGCEWESPIYRQIVAEKLRTIAKSTHETHKKDLENYIFEVNYKLKCLNMIAITNILP
mgnify:CR=1 FL=1